MEQDCLIYLKFITKWKNMTNKKMCKDKWNYINGNYNWMYDYDNCIGNNICSWKLLIEEWLFNSSMNIVTMLWIFFKEKTMSTLHYMWGPTIVMRWKACNNKPREEQEKHLLAPCPLMQGLCREKLCFKGESKSSTILSRCKFNI